MKESIVYESLDFQLADFLEELNTEKNAVLRQLTLDVSKKTREGHIAFACEAAIIEAALATKVVGLVGEKKPLLVNNGFVYLNRYWSYQQRLAQQIRGRLSVELETANLQWIRARLRYYFTVDETVNNVQGINWQRTAAALALISRFLVISGGPGTGKTTTITRILALLIEQHSDEEGGKKPLKFALAAPTGKAAMRMSESIRDSIHREAGRLDDCIIEQLPQGSSTIHRLLGYVHNSSTFKFNKNNKLSADVVIVDEASMIDLALMTKLFEAIPEHAKVILLGDKDQLSSVETGSVFTDLCATADNKYAPKWVEYVEKVTDRQLDISQDQNAAIDNHIVYLRKSWRFDEHSGIGRLASAVNDGLTEASFEVLDDKTFTDANLLLSSEFKRTQLVLPWAHYVQALAAKASIKDLFAAFNNFRILTALRKGVNGSVYLNTQLEKQLSQQYQLSMWQRWYHGRPIMITENSYRIGLFNGDIGITLIDKQGQAKVWFQTSEGEKAFSPVRLPHHETAWVMTIHKSQGSEFERVLMILPTEDVPVLTRQLIYTGITRAKSQIDVVSNKNILVLGIEREMQQATRIQEALRKVD